MQIFLFHFILLFFDLPVGRSVDEKALELRSYRCVRKQNPQSGFSAKYFSNGNQKYVDNMIVNFAGLYETRECNRRPGKVPILSITREGNIDPVHTASALDHRLLDELNPCAVYHVHVNDPSIKDLIVGPYYKYSNLGKPLIRGFPNKEYEKNLTNAAITVTPRNESARIKLSPICAKTVQLEIVPENEKDQENEKVTRAYVDPSKMEEIDFFVDNLQPCTKYVVHLYLSLRTQNATEFEEDYTKEDITTFSTLPNLEEMKNPGMYDNSSHFLSWDIPWEILQQECSEPILAQNPQLTLTIGKRSTNVNLVSNDALFNN